MKIFRAVLMCAVFFTASFSAYATDYYFSLAGNDSNSGLSEASPFKTLSKASSIRVVPGDRLLFRRGDVFRGELRMIYAGTTTEPITIESYGSGADAVISGSEFVNNWLPAGNGIYRANCAVYPQMVFQHGRAQQLARFPNSGFLFVDNGNGNLGFTDNDLPNKGGLYVGAGVHIRTSRFRYEERNVLVQAGGYLGFDRPTSTAIVKDAGYYLSNKLEFVDMPGEYYYDGKNKQLFLKTLDGKAPADNTVEVSTYAYGIKAESAANLVIKNITIRHQETAGLYILGSKTDNLDISNCVFQNIYLYGILGANKNALTVRENKFYDIWDCAVFIGGMTNVNIHNNNFQRIGIQAPGRATDDLISYRCIDMNGSSGTVSDNVIDSVGFSGIVFFQNTTVERNRVSRFCLSIDDGSGIGAHGTDKGIRNGTNCFVRQNIISNAAGTAESFPMRSDPFVNGIFMDDNSGNAVIENNTIYNIEGKGIFIHNSSYNQIKNNTIFNCTGGALVMEHDYSGGMPSGNQASGNILYNIGQTEHNLRLANWHAGEPGLNFGSFSNNYYINPYNDAVIYLAEYGMTNLGYIDLLQSEYTVRGWREKRDANAKSSPARLLPFKVNSTSGSNLVTNGSFDSNLNGWGCYAEKNTCSVEWKNDGTLDGGYVKVASPWYDYGNFFNTNLVTLQKDQQYLLTYSIVGQENKISAFNIQDKNNGYAQLTPQVKREVATKRLDHQILLSPNANTNSGQLSFYLGPKLITGFSLDNIKLQQVSAVMIDPLTQNLFYVNPTGSGQTIDLPGIFLDVNGDAVSGKVTIPPFSAKIFMASEQGALPLNFLSITARKTVAGDAEIKWSVAGTLQDCKMDVEKSTDGINFTAIGTLNTSQGITDYTFTDVEFMQISFYRINSRCASEGAVYSKIVRLENDKDLGQNPDISVYPNPVPANKVTVVNNDHYTEAALFDPEGRKLLRVKLTHGSNTVIIPSHAGPGIYFLKVTGENREKTFKLMKK